MQNNNGPMNKASRNAQQFVTGVVESPLDILNSTILKTNFKTNIIFLNSFKLKPINHNRNKVIELLPNS